MERRPAAERIARNWGRGQLTVVSFLSLIGIARTSSEPPKVDRPNALEDEIFALFLSQL
jgi:hypothetical protein